MTASGRCLAVRRVCIVARRTALAVVLAHLTLLDGTPGRAESAIAFGQRLDGAWTAGFGWGLATQSEAQATAIKNCQAQGLVCAVVATFRKTCGAFAAQDYGNGWAVDYAANDNAARRDALQRCAAMGSSCSVRESFCDTFSEEEQAFQEYSREWGECFGVATTEVDAARNLASCNQALAFPRAVTADRDKLTRQRALLQTTIQNYRDQARREEQEARDHARREEQERIQQAAAERERNRYLAQHKGCAEFDVASCTAALQNPLAAYDRDQLRSWFDEAQRFNQDVAACRNGSVTACDLAANSNAATPDYQQYIKQWRAAASPWNKFLALLTPYWQSVRATWNSVVATVAEIPLSTIIASTVAAVFGMSLLGILFIQRWRSRRRSFETATAVKPLDQRKSTAPPEARPDPIVVNIEPKSPSTSQNGAAVDNGAIKQSFRKRRVEFEL